MTKTFFIRYAEENVCLRHVIKFRTEIDVNKLHQNQKRMSVIFDPNKPSNQFVDNEFYMRVELYYSQPPQHNFVRASNSAEIMKEEVSKGTGKFKCVQTKLYQINRALRGLSTFVPIQFDREYTSMCLFTLHSSVIDFKFFAPSTANAIKKGRRKPLHDANSDGEDEVQTFMENGILVERKYVDRERDFGVEKQERASTKKWNAHNITEYLFFNEFGSLEISEEIVTQTYGAYTSVLKLAHKQLRKNYMELAEYALGNS